MNVARVNHTATLLVDGRVLVTGGDPGGNSAELYDPTLGTWQFTTHSMATARADHSAVRLSDGRVLIFGCGAGFNTSEIFDPATQQFTATGNLNIQRCSSEALLLSDGRVMVIAGRIPGGSPFVTATSEIYNPATGVWTLAASLPTAGTGAIAPGYTNHTASLLPDGKVVVTGGYDGFTFNTASGVFRYDPATNIWTTLSAMAVQRNQHAAAVLPSGRLVIVAGRHPSSISFSYGSTELYDFTVPAAVPGPSLANTRANLAIVRLQDGRVLASGGFNYLGSPCCNVSTASLELFDEGAGTWTEVGPMVIGRSLHTATQLMNGQVLFAGGMSYANPSGDVGVLNSAELWPASPAVTEVGIDIKPGSFPNSLNPGSNGSVPVAVLGSATFTVLSVNATSLTFGRTGTEASLRFHHGAPQCSLEDVNGDSRTDLICHFQTRSTGFQSGDTVGMLRGQTTGGVQFSGTDTVRIVP